MFWAHFILESALTSRLHRPLVLIFALLLLAGCQTLKQKTDAPRSEIRFYTINNLDQQRELSWLPKRHAEGCFNLPVSLHLFRIAQIGFTSCSVYRSKGCAPTHIHPMVWSGKIRKNSNKQEPTFKMTEGAMWLFSRGREAAVRSWQCSH